MDVDAAITARRSIKRYSQEPLDPELVRELVQLAAWAPNHSLTQPWRFRLLGPEATKVIVDVAPADKKMKMTLAPTRLLVSCVIAGDPGRRTEDLAATAAAVQTLLLAATARGLGSFWQTPTVAAQKAVRGLLGIPEQEELVGVIHLGAAAEERPAPARLPLDQIYAELP